MLHGRAGDGKVGNDDITISLSLSLSLSFSTYINVVLVLTTDEQGADALTALLNNERLSVNHNESVVFNH